MPETLQPLMKKYKHLQSNGENASIILISKYSFLYKLFCLSSLRDYIGKRFYQDLPCIECVWGSPTRATVDVPQLTLRLCVIH